MWKHNLFCFGKKRGHKPAKKNSRGESAEELRCYKARRIGRTNRGKRVCECSSVKARASVTAWIGKGGGSRKPVCAGYVKTDRHRNRFGAQPGTAPNDAKQPKRCNKFAKKLIAAGAGVMRDL